MDKLQWMVVMDTCYFGVIYPLKIITLLRLMLHRPKPKNYTTKDHEYTYIIMILIKQQLKY